MSRKKPKLTTDELRVLVSRQITQASSSTAISAERSDLFDAYMGEPYAEDADIPKGKSYVVSTDVSDTIEWIMPELMEIFTSGDKVVSFEPLGPDDEERAEQETDVVNHVFMRQNDGFLILYSMLKDGLVQKNGYVKRWWDKRTKVNVEEYDGLAPEDVLQLEQQWAQYGAEVEILEGETGPDGIHIKVKLTEECEGEKLAPVPPEELLIHPRWNSISLVGCPFVAHKKTETISALIEMGFERKQLEALGEAADEEFSEERIGRFNADGSEEDSDGEPADKSMTEILIHECYIYMDHNGDGIAELRKITVAGTGHEILRLEDGEDANEEIMGDCPISAWTPIIVPHRHFGRSVGELVTDLQRIKTDLQRNTLDNFRANNNPTREIAEDGIGENTIEDMLIDRPGKIVRTALPGHYVEHVPPQFAAQSLAVIEYFDTVRENRTGVSRLSQGLDANTINKTARGQAQLMTAAQKKIALIARIAAETGVKDLFRGIHDDLRRNATKAMTVRLTGGWVQIDPRHWRSRADVAANVALGIGSAEQQMQKLMLIAERQEQNLLAGSPLVTPKNLHHTYEKMIDVAGFKNPSAFFTDPDTVEPREPPPDPQMVQVQGLLQIEAQKVQNQAQNDQQKMMLEGQKAASEAGLKEKQISLDVTKLQEEAREKDKKIELMQAQIDKIHAEIRQGNAQLHLEAEKAEADFALRGGEHGLKVRASDRDDTKTKAEIEHKGAEIGINAHKAHSEDRHRTADREEGAAERKAKVGLTEAQAHATRHPPKDKAEKAEKPEKKRATITEVLEHDDKGRIKKTRTSEED
jgi:hypothetical protein